MIRHTVSMTLRSTIDAPSDREPIIIPELLVSRRADSFSVHAAYVDHESDAEAFHLKNKNDARAQWSAATAWAVFVSMFGASEFAVFVGPGLKDVVLRDVSILADEYQVFTVSPSGYATLVHRAVHRLQAMQVAKQIIEDGGCPLVISHFNDPGNEWDEESVDAYTEQRQELVEVAT